MLKDKNSFHPFGNTDFPLK